ncbi:ABC transporter substrate-binding protein [Nonomuraea turkmeniaca]|uniref:ABC transporter substrate-binding protein n=1 Tax=Nonomuraea turkmeniaca TaxID=103838 RepID=UPI001476BFFE|nr:extracellular solute-binding protein [Nonomuraea turkmeniaca]
MTAVLLIGALGLAACGKKNSGETAAQESLSYRSSWGAAEPQAKIIKTLFDDFAKETGAKVDLKFVGRTGNENLNAEMASGQGPDLFDTTTGDIETLTAQNLISPLGDVEAAQVPGEGKTVKDVLPEPVRRASSGKNGLAYLPHTIISTAVWYNAAEHPGLNPQTWEEFIAFLDESKKAGRTPIGQDGTIAFYNVFWFYSLLVGANGAGSLAELAKDPANWDKPQVLDAAEKVEQLAKGGYLQRDFMATKFPAAQNAWAQGTYDLNINGTWLASEVQPQLTPGFKVASFQVPAGGKKSIEVGTLGWAVNAKGKNVATAKKFLAFALQKKYMEQFSTVALNIPSRGDVPAPAHMADVQKAVLEAKETHLSYDYAGADKTWWGDMFLPLSDKLISGKIDAATFIREGKKRTADHLANG